LSFFGTAGRRCHQTHGILRRYLPIFVRETGSASRGGRVVYLDGYAGPGAYDDGQPGSPILAATTAEELQDDRALVCLYVEKSA
jgi:three-Cys-motif partner protein